MPRRVRDHHKIKSGQTFSPYTTPANHEQCGMCIWSKTNNQTKINNSQPQLTTQNDLKCIFWAKQVIKMIIAYYLENNDSKFVLELVKYNSSAPIMFLLLLLFVVSFPLYNQQQGSKLTSGSCQEIHMNLEHLCCSKCESTHSLQASYQNEPGMKEKRHSLDRERNFEQL